MSYGKILTANFQTNRQQNGRQEYNDIP